MDLRSRVLTATGVETPWPVADVLEKLAHAANHLLADHSCDAHGYEEAALAAGKAPRLARAIRELGWAATIEPSTSEVRVVLEALLGWEKEAREGFDIGGPEMEPVWDDARKLLERIGAPTLKDHLLAAGDDLQAGITATCLEEGQGQGRIALAGPEGPLLFTSDGRTMTYEEAAQKFRASLGVDHHVQEWKPSREMEVAVAEEAERCLEAIRADLVAAGHTDHEGLAVLGTREMVRRLLVHEEDVKRARAAAQVPMALGYEDREGRTVILERPALGMDGTPNRVMAVHPEDCHGVRPWGAQPWEESDDLPEAHPYNTGGPIDGPEQKGHPNEDLLARASILRAQNGKHHPDGDTRQVAERREQVKYLIDTLPDGQ